MKNNKGLDKTSAIMIAVFALLIVGAVIGIAAASIKSTNKAEENLKALANEVTIPFDASNVETDTDGILTVDDILKAVPNALPGSTYSYFDDDGNYRTVTIPDDYNKEAESTKVDNSEKYQFTEFTDLSDKFLEVCKAGDVDELYKLYYGDFLDRARLSMEEIPSKAAFDAGLRENMLSITGFDEYPYGSVELIDTQPAGMYASQIYYNTYQESLPMEIAEIEDCVNLVVYINNMYQTNHFMVKVDGFWYFIV